MHEDNDLSMAPKEVNVYCGRLSTILPEYGKHPLSIAVNEIINVIVVTLPLIPMTQVTIKKLAELFHLWLELKLESLS